MKTSTLDLMHRANELFNGRVSAGIRRIPCTQGDATYAGSILVNRRTRSVYDMNATPGNVSIEITVSADFEEEVAEELDAILTLLESGSGIRKARSQ